MDIFFEVIVYFIIVVKSINIVILSILGVFVLNGYRSYIFFEV